MIIVVDSNVLVAAFAFRSHRLTSLLTWLRSEQTLIVTEYVAWETARVIRNKRPEALAAFDDFLRAVEVVIDSGSNAHVSSAPVMRDVDDQPILNAAIAIDADIIITGDKDFHTISIDRPRIMTPAAFADEFLPKT